MPSGLDLLSGRKITETTVAPNSNLPPFDVALTPGADPLEEAKKITGVKSGVDLLKVVQTSKGIVPPLPIDKTIETRNKAIREFYESGSLWAAQLIPGQLGNAEAPEPPGGWSKEGQPLDEGGKPYVSRVAPEKPKLPYDGVLSLSKGTDKPNFIERSLNAITGMFGGNNVGKLSEGAKAQALIMHMAKEEGIPLDQFRQSPELVEKAASSFISMSTFGLAPAIKKELTGEIDFPATSTQGYIGEALGSLAGLYGGPLQVAGKVMKPVLNFLPQAVQGEKIAARVLKSALRDTLLLAPALGVAATGEALEQVSFPQAAGKIWDGVKSGATIGAIFGMSRGLFPAEGVQTGARIFTGLVGLNAYRATEMGGNPFTNRPVGDVLFDTALDAVFLYKGLPKNMRFEIADDLKNLNDRIDKSKVPPPSPEGGENIPPEVLQQAQQKAAEVEKIQIDLEAKRVAEKAKAAVEAKAELEAKGEEIRKIKEGELEKPIEEEIAAIDNEALIKLGYDEKDLAGMPEDQKDFIIEHGIMRKASKTGVELVEPKGKAKKAVKTGAELLKSKLMKEDMESEGGPDFVPSELKPSGFSPTDNLFNNPAVKGNTTYAWRSMGEKEYTKLLGGEKEYLGEKQASKGNFLAGIPESAGQFGGKGKYLVEFGGVKIAGDEGLSPGSKATRDNITKVWKFNEKTNQWDSTDIGAKVEAKKPKTILRKKAKPAEPLTPLDEATGSPKPAALASDVHPLRDTRVDYTNGLKKLYQDKVNSRSVTPELFTRYLINEVNRYLNGENVPIEKVRKGLSELSARADNMGNSFDRPEDHRIWKNTVNEAAKWAREADRIKNIRTDKGTQLNMMIPVNEIPEMVKVILRKLKVGRDEATKIGETYFATPEDEKVIPASSLYRNKEVFDATGFWLGRDLKWRYEIGPEDIKPLSSQQKLHLQTGGISYGYLPAYLGDSKLFKDVPELKKVKVIFDKNNKEGKASGTYRSEIKTIEVYEDWQNSFNHELQHAVNDVVGSKFKGTSPESQEQILAVDILKGIRDKVKDPFIQGEVSKVLDDYLNTRDHKAVNSRISELAKIAPTEDAVIIKTDFNRLAEGEAFERYKKDPGEMEARLSEKRMDMTPEQRKAEPPWETLENMLKEEGMIPESKYIDFGEPDLPTRVVTDFSKSPGLKLYSGIPIDEASKAIIAGAKRLAEYTRKARGMKEFDPKLAAEMLKEEFIRNFVDRSGNIRRELLDKLGNQGYEIVQKMYLSKGASSLAAMQLKQMRDEVYSGLSKDDKRILDNLILSDRMIDIGKYKTTKQFAFPEGLTPIEAASYNELFQYIEKITPEKAELLKQRSGAYFEWMKKPLKDMLDAELISQEEFDALSSHNYRRLKLVDVFDKRYQAKIGKKKRTVYDSGVESLAHGRDTDVFEPSSEVMALEVFNRAYGRILNNAANRTLLDLARTDKENPFVRTKESPKDRIPSGWDRVFVYEKGERKAIYLSPEMSKEWITNNPEMSYKLSQFLRYASGSPVLRTFATGIDWGFALANLPRDVMHTWYTARTFKDGKWESVYSSNLPMFGLQMLDDQIATFSDALLRKGRYEDYIREGGGMEFLVHQGRLLQRGRHIEGGLDKVQDFLGYFGETTEIMTRLAIRERVIRNRAKERGITFEEASKNKKIRQEATFAARDYMDFGQGGGITKALDNGIPYLNASVVGTRGLLRSFQPGSGTAIKSTYKLAQFAALVTGLYIANQQLNPETMKSLQGNIDMQNNLVIPLGDGFSFLDEKGQTRYPYLKIPLDPGQKFFKKFFEASTDKWLGNPVNVDEVTNSLTQLSPVGISSLPPTISGVLGYFTNKNFWLNEDIWKKTDKPFSWPQSKEEYIPGQTPQALIDLGSLTGMSPERTKYMLGQLVTNGSIWAQIAGQGYDVLLGDMPKDKKEMHLAEVLSKTPVIRRFIGVTNPYSQFATPVEEARSMSTLERWIQNRGLDTLVDAYLYKEGTSRKEVVDYIRSFKDKDIGERLKDRFEFSEKIKDLPNRSFWLALQGTPDTEARAKLYVDRLKASNEEERAQLMKEVGIVNEAGGIISDEFKQATMRLRR